MHKRWILPVRGDGSNGPDCREAEELERSTGSG